LSIAAAWLWTCLRTRPRLVVGCLVGLWAVVMLVMNRQGFDLWVTLYFLLIPPPVFALTLSYLGGRGRPNGHRFWLTGHPARRFGAGVVHPIRPDLFIEVRDHLLLSNPVGMA